MSEKLTVLEDECPQCLSELESEDITMPGQSKDHIMVKCSNCDYFRIDVEGE